MNPRKGKVILMLQKIESYLSISVKERGTGKEIDLSKAKNILFGIRQQYGTYLEFPGRYENGKVVVKVPYEDAMLLTTSPTRGQLYWTDENDNKKATVSAPVHVDELLREAGYD